MSLPMDDVAVEIAPGADLSADPSTWTWSDLCAHTAEYPAGRVQRPVTITQGRRSEGSTAPPSTCTFDVRNEDGALTPTNPTGPWYGALGRGTPLRVSWGGSERFFGFISELPTTWLGIVDNSRVRIAAEGPTRRMEQGAEALRSPLYRSLSTHPNVVAYWPCEDGRDATQAASPIAGVRPLSTSGVQFGQSTSEGDLIGSGSVMQVGTGAKGLVGRVPNHTVGDVYVVECAVLIPEEPGAAVQNSVLNVFTTSADVAQWQIRVSSTTFQVRAWDGDSVSVVSESTTVSSALWGQWVRAELRFWTAAANVTWEAILVATDAGGTVLNSLNSQVLNADKGRLVRAGVTAGGIPQERFMAHLAVLTGTIFELPPQVLITPLSAEDRHAPFHGYTGELAADRFERLCREEGLSCELLALTGGLRESTGLPGDNASAPDSAAFDVTDLDVRCWVAASEWADGTFRWLVQRWDTTGDQRSFILQIGNDGEIGLMWSTDGTAAGVQPTAESAPLAPMPPNDGLLAVRATLVVDNGAGGHDIALSVAPDVDTPDADWTVVHSETRVGATSIHAGSAALVVGGTNTNGTPVGLFRAVRLYDGVAGTLVADPVFASPAVGATSFSDDAGNTWTVNGDAEMVRADDSMPMGPQRHDTLLANFRDVEATDGGILNELTYRTRTHLYNQTATAIEFCDLNGAPELVNDDRSTRNDVTASRPFGSSVRLVDQDHIDRFGRYDDSREANVADEDLLRQVAGWWLSQGTSEVPRWPLIPLVINSETQDMLADWLALRVGDRISIPHEVPQMLGVDVDLIVEGWTEAIYSRRAEMVLTCTPAYPYDVATFDSARFDAADSTTSGSFVAGTDTSLTVVSGGQPWVNSADHASEFPLQIRVSGVVLNVTAISGAASPQTFTVDATPINGVVKTIPDGSAVRLATTPTFAL